MENKKTVYSTASKIIYSLSNSLETPNTRATLANLRNSIGKPIFNTMDALSLMYKHLPEEYISKGQKPTYQEKAIMSSLQLYALHQQGKNDSVNETNGFYNIGYSLGKLRGEDSKAIDRRFNVLMGTEKFEDLIYYLRHLTKLAKNGNIKINYSKLAEDLFWYQMGKENSVKFQWGREYYKFRGKQEEKKGEKNE